MSRKELRFGYGDYERRNVCFESVVRALQAVSEVWGDGAKSTKGCAHALHVLYMSPIPAALS